MRHRRKSAGVWFPNSGSSSQSGDNQYNNSSWVSSIAAADIPIVSGVAPTLQVRALTFDYTQEPSQSLSDRNSLRDLVEGQDWVCKRIVGKFHAGVLYGSHLPSEDWVAYRLALGIFVARSKDNAEAEPDLLGEELDPLSADNIQDPWMFRRTWTLGGGPLTNDTLDGTSQSVSQNGGKWPSTTAGYGSLLDGPHIDVKSKRRITREHRLWAVVAIQGWGAGFEDPSSHGSSLYWDLDYRIFGAMRRATQKGAASF